MKKIIPHVLVLFSLALISCTEEQLVIVNNELEFEENSRQYQVYQAEKAMYYIRSYRFEKLGNVMSKINDEDLRNTLLDSLNKYKIIAQNEALYFVKENNDTLYFFPPENDNPTYQEEMFLGGSFRRGSMAVDLGIKDSKGVMHGFKNFSRTTIFRFYNTLASGIEGMEHLPNLKSFEWVLIQADVEKEILDDDFSYIPLRADLTNNHKLEEIIVTNVELGHVSYPNHQVDEIRLSGSLKTGTLEGLNAKEANVFGAMFSEDKVLNIKNSRINTLSIGHFSHLTLGHLNVSSSQIVSLWAPSVEEITFNEGLEELQLNAKNLKELPDLPLGLKKLSLNNFPFKPDFSDLMLLNSLSLHYATGNDYTNAPNWTEVKLNDLKLPASLKHIDMGTAGYYEYSLEGMQLPITIETVSFSARIKEGTLDLSNLPNLKEVKLYISNYTGATIHLPPSIEMIEFDSYLKINRLDLSKLTNLQHLKLGILGIDRYPSSASDIESMQQVELVLPPNLSESVFTSFSSTVKPVGLKVGSTIINKPEWFDNYVHYYE